MGIDVTVQPISMDWAGLDGASLDALADVANYDRPGVDADRSAARAAIDWDTRPEIPYDLTEEQIAASVAAVQRLQSGLAERIGAPVSWAEKVPAPLDFDAWEEAEGFIGQLAPDGLDEMLGIAAVLSSGVKPESLEQLMNTGSDELTRRVWDEGSGSFANILAISISTLFVPAPLPHPLVGPAHRLASRGGLASELERFAEAAFGVGLDELLRDPPFGGGLRDSIISNVELIAEGLEVAAARGLPLVVSG